MPRKNSHSGGRNICGTVYGPTGQKCTKKPEHYNKTRSLHSSEATGAEIAWDEDGYSVHNPNRS